MHDAYKIMEDYFTNLNVYNIQEQKLQINQTENSPKETEGKGDGPIVDDAPEEQLIVDFVLVYSEDCLLIPSKNRAITTYLSNLEEMGLIIDIEHHQVIYFYYPRIGQL